MKTTRTYPSWIAGLRYRGPDGTNRGRYCVRHLELGTPLDLVPEPNNPHGDHAVAVKHHGHHLGYIPARHSWIGEAIVDESEILNCNVDRIETVGWLFPRASFVGLRVVVINHREAVKVKTATASRFEDMTRQKLEQRARDVCLDGLRVLDYIAPPNHSFSSEMNIEASYIEARLAMSGFQHDSTLMDALIGFSQGLIVRKSSFIRAVNGIVGNDVHYKLVCEVANQLAEISGPNQFQSEALTRLLEAGSKLPSKRHSKLRAR